MKVGVISYDKRGVNVNNLSIELFVEKMMDLLKRKIKRWMICVKLFAYEGSGLFLDLVVLYSLVSSVLDGKQTPSSILILAPNQPSFLIFFYQSGSNKMTLTFYLLHYCIFRPTFEVVRYIVKKKDRAKGN